MRHIGYVLKRFPRISETFVAAEIIEMERQGEHVSIFAVSKPDEPFSHAFIDEIRASVVYLPHRPWREPLRVARALRRALRDDPRGWLGAAAASLWPPRLVGLRHLLQATVLLEEMRRREVTHAHAHFASTAARLANLARRMGGPTYSVTAHAKDIYHHDVRLDHLRDKLAGATFVATVSEANRRYLAGALGGHERLRLVPNAVDLQRIGPPRSQRPAEQIVLAVGRFVEKKGLEYLVEACGRLRRAGRPVRLELVGDGPLRRKLEDAALRWRVPAVFHGSLAHEDVVPIFARAAVFCLPCVVASTGDRDGLPTAVLEAMAIGVPVVTTAVNGLADLVVDGETGLLVPERDPIALARAIERLLGDPALATRLAAQGRQAVEARHSVQSSVAELRAEFPEAA
jgi:glycosyltransferase involved in cell wall biosynthesis